jgi:chemosensory pili system protein ChpC
MADPSKRKKVSKKKSAARKVASKKTTARKAAGTPSKDRSVSTIETETKALEKTDSQLNGPALPDQAKEAVAEAKIAPEQAVPEASSGQDADHTVIHCTLARMEKESLLVPTSVIAEIAEYSTPQPIDASPAWLLGQIEWENWQVPVISYSALINGDMPQEATAKSRTMIIKSLSDGNRVPYIGVLVADLPKLSQVKPSSLKEKEDEAGTLGVFCRVDFNGTDTIIPDLDRLSQMVAHAAFGTLPGEAAAAKAN